MSETVCVDRERWERVRGEAALLVDMQQAGQILGVDALLPGDLDDIPATTERPSVEAMIDELMEHRMDVRFWMSAPGFQEMMVSGREQSIIRTIIDDGDWRSALRAAYEQVRRGDGGERG